MSTKFLSPGWRMPRNANQSKSSNYSMDFDGSQSVDVGTVTINNSGSFSIWFKISNIAYYQNILGSSNASGMFKYITLRNGILYQYVLGTGWIVLYSTSLDDNEWHNLVFTYDSTTSGGPARGTFKSYVDGVLTKTHDMINDVSEDWSSSTLTSIAYFGTTQPLGARYFDGQITEVSIFDYALSASQVTTLYGTGSAIGNPMALPSLPIAYYPLGTSAFNGEYLAENNAIGDYVFDFNGSNDYIDTGSADYTEGITTMSISGWFNPNAAGGQGAAGIVAKESRDFYVGWYNVPANSIRFLISDDDGATQDSLNSLTLGSNTDVLGKWHHFVCTWDASDKLKIYINGNFSSETNSVYATSALPTSTNILEIGRRVSTYFDGAISNIQIFNTVLPATDVETLYNYGSPIRTLANIPQSSNLKAWYKLDASEVYNSTTTEWSIDNNQNPSAYPSSLNFNGSSDYIDCGTGSRFNINQITISAWVNLSSGLTSTQIIAGIRNNTSGGGSICYQLQNQASGKFRFVIRQSNGTYVDSVANDVHQYNTWYHVLGVADGSNIKLYVNGNLQTIVSSYDGTIYSPNENFNIGKQSSPSNYYWDGKLSNVSVFNTGLTSAQVEELYNNGTPSNLSNHSATSNLVSWWKLNNTTTGIEDAKGSNNGTNYGATEYAGFVNKLVGESSGMTQANLVQSDLQTVAPYSKYAMDFDGTADYIDCGDSDDFSFGDGANDSPFSYSTWVNMDDATSFVLFSKYPDDNAHTKREYRIFISNADKPYLILYDAGTTSSINYRVATNAITSYQNQWINLTFTYDGRGGNLAGDGIKIYLNGSSIALDATISSSYVSMHNTSTPARIGRTLTSYPNGKISNCSLWNTALTSAQVSEIYNEGLPGNLNSHSAYSNLISWWQLGENSSFDGNDWIVADEKGTNNGTSVSMPVGALVNGVGTTANGVSSGMSEGNLVGDAPYSTANAISTNMVVTSRVTGSGNTP